MNPDPLYVEPDPEPGYPDAPATPLRLAVLLVGAGLLVAAVVLVWRAWG